MISVKNLKFLHRFLFGKFGLLKVFGDVLERDLAFLDNKKKPNEESRKFSIFPKRLVHGFNPKFHISLFVQFRHIWPRKRFW